MNAGLGNAGVRASKTPQAPAATVTAANNGTSLSGTTVQLGQSVGAVGNPAALLSNRETPTSAFFINFKSSSITATLIVDSTTASTNAALVVRQTGATGLGMTVNSTGGEAITAQSTGNIGVLSLSLAAEAFFGTAVQSWAGVMVRQLAAVGNLAADVLDIRTTTAVAAANGLGGIISYRIQTTTSGGRRANELVSAWTDATDATRTCQLIVRGVANAVTADLLTISGSGAARLNKYGIGTFAGVPAFTLQVDANGNIIEGAAAGGGWGTTGTVATLTGNAALKLGGNTFAIEDGANGQFFVDPTNQLYKLGDIAGAGNNNMLMIDGTGDLIYLGNQARNFLQIGTFNGALAFLNATDIFFQADVPAGIYSLGPSATGNNSNLTIDDATKVFAMTSAGGAGIGGIKTNAPTATGAGLWLLGKQVAAAVAFDATQYVETMIDGVAYKLAIAV